MKTIELAARQRTLPALLRAQAEAFGARPWLAVGEAAWSHADAAAVAARPRCRAPAWRAATAWR
jgi:hypothetical protein